MFSFIMMEKKKPEINELLQRAIAVYPPLASPFGKVRGNSLMSL